MKEYIVHLHHEPDWRTQYSPELVGEYLKTLRKRRVNLASEAIKVEDIGKTIYFSHEPTLEGFLMWCAEKGDKDGRD